MFKAIFWDNDGVLVDTEKLFFKATQEIFAQQNFQLTQKDFIQYFLHQNIGTWPWLENAGMSKSEIIQLKKIRNRRYSELIQREEITINGVAETLQTLNRDFRMAVVTSSHKNHFMEIHQKTNLLHYFDFIIFGEDCQHTKPDPEPYLMALQRANLQPEECLVIEDSPRGLAAAKAAGITCWAIPTELTENECFNEADRVLEAITDIPGLLGF